jgi:hypothetical protein
MDKLADEDARGDGTSNLTGQDAFYYNATRKFIIQHALMEKKTEKVTT